MGFFDRLREGLKKTQKAIFGPLNKLFSSYGGIDDDFYEELSDLLIMADIGVSTAGEICDALRARVKEKKIKEAAQAKEELIEIMSGLIGDGDGIDLSSSTAVVLVIGVNGVGKTTSIGKIAYDLKKRGKKVVLAAADTFRAAAIEQLSAWAARADVPIIKQSEGRRAHRGYGGQTPQQKEPA